MFRLMQTFDTYYEGILHKLIKAEEERLTENIINTNMPDLEIQRQIAKVKALRFVREELMPEADKLSKERK